MRMVTARRLRVLEDAADRAERSLLEARAGADRMTARYAADLAASTKRAQAAEHRAEALAFRADQSAREASELLDEVKALEGRLNEPRGVFVLLRRGRLHSVHGNAEAAYAAAESDPVDPATRDGWAGWHPVIERDPSPAWEVRRLAVHEPRPGVHGVPAGVHGGVHGG